MQQLSSSPRHGQNAPFPRRPLLLTLAVMLVVAAIAFGAGMLVSGHSSPAQPPPPTVFTPAAATASVVTLDAVTVKACTVKITNTGTWSVSAAGTVRTTQTHKVACGHAYQKWEHITSRSKTGAHYYEDLYRDERGYPAWRQRTAKHAWTAKGAFTLTVTVTTGG